MSIQTNRYQEIADELRAVQQEMLELLECSRRLLRDAPNLAYQRADAYWLAHARMALTNEHGYLGRSMMTMDDTINEVARAANADEDGADAYA